MKNRACGGAVICALIAFLLTGVVSATTINSAPFANQSKGFPSRKQSPPETPRGISPMSKGAGFASRQVRAFRTTAPRPRSVASQGGLFANAVTYNSGGYLTVSVAVSDVNGDGKPDLVLTNACAAYPCSTEGEVSVLLGNGDGTFQAGQIYNTGAGYAEFVAVADVNGDGKPDLIVANECTDSNCQPDQGVVSVLMGNGDGTFQPAVTYSSGGYDAASIAIADVNGDGKPDIVVVNSCWSCATHGSVGVLLGNGDGTFQSAVAFDSGGFFPDSLAMSDLNGDGKPDVLVDDCAGQGESGQCVGGLVAVFLGNGDGTFRLEGTYGPTKYQPTSVAVGDINGDGKPDFVFANEGSAAFLRVYLGNGDGTFQLAGKYSSCFAQSVAIADVNGDGNPDLLVANACSNSSSVAVMLGNGDGSFQPQVTYTSGGYDGLLIFTSPVAVADVNGDALPDVVVPNQCVSSKNCDSGSVGVLINTGLTATATTLSSSPNPSKHGQTVTFTARVIAKPGFHKGIPTGTVSFFDGKSKVGTSTLNRRGVATFKTSKLAKGGHRMKATYDGDTNFGSSTSSVLRQVVQ